MRAAPEDFLPLTAGFFERRWGTILSSLLAVFLLGGSVLAALVPGATTSFVGVAGGLLGGVLSAAYLGWSRRKNANPDNLIADRMPSAAELASRAQRFSSPFRDRHNLRKTKSNLSYSFITNDCSVIICALVLRFWQEQTL